MSPVPPAHFTSICCAAVLGPPATFDSQADQRYRMYLIEALCCVQLHGVWWIYLLGQIIGAFLGAGVSTQPQNDSLC